MSPDDDWALGQNEVDVRNEARNPLNAIRGRVDARVPKGTVILKDGDRELGRIENIFACRNPEQAWIDESRAEAEREDT